MGLDVSHDCWSGGYGSFYVWRKELAKAASMPPLERMVGFNGDIEWKWLKEDALHILLDHSDCDDIIRVRHCKCLADRLAHLLCHIDVDWRARTQQFINGLKLADSLNEDVEFC